MLCYRDMTFCSFHKDCKKGKSCIRALTDKIQQKANEWWGTDGGAPICTFLKKPKCFNSKK